MVIDRIDEPCEAAAQLSIEQAIFKSMTSGSRRLRLWQPLPALIATAAEASQPGFARAAASAHDRGWPVCVRRSGGGAVCMGPGSLIISYFYGSRRNNIAASYRAFTQVLLAASASVHASLNSEHVTSAYCDGRFDLAWRGLKVGGIAQCRRLWQGTALIWIHAVLAVEARAAPYPQRVTEFYAHLGSSRTADPHATTTLWHCLPADSAPHDLLSRYCDAIVREIDLFGVDGTCGGLHGDESVDDHEGVAAERDAVSAGLRLPDDEPQRTFG